MGGLVSLLDILLSLSACYKLIITWGGNNNIPCADFAGKANILGVSTISTSAVCNCPSCSTRVVSELSMNLLARTEK